MTVCAVTVTYADRFRLLAAVVEALWREGADEIIIINNCSAPKSEQQLRVLEKQYASRLTVFHFAKNGGSAKGFKKGLELALYSPCDFIWLLDDDNMPKPGALEALKNFWATLPTKNKESSTALCSFREDRENYADAIRQKDPTRVLPPLNNYAGFHVGTLGKKIWERFTTHKNNAPVEKEEPARLAAAAYGGLFFHKMLLQRIGFPNEAYVLYADDFDYTYRFYLAGGTIIVLPSSAIADTETSFYLPTRKSIFYHSALVGKNDALVYYNFRNLVYFSANYLRRNKIIWVFNKLFFMAFITAVGLLRGKRRRLRLLFDALADGEAGQLGENTIYTL